MPTSATQMFLFTSFTWLWVAVLEALRNQSVVLGLEEIYPASRASDILSQYR